jgi:hypothetical protein
MRCRRRRRRRWAPRRSRRQRQRRLRSPRRPWKAATEAAEAKPTKKANLKQADSEQCQAAAERATEAEVKFAVASGLAAVFGALNPHPRFPSGVPRPD